MTEILINFIITIIIIISAVFVLAYLEKRLTALFLLQNKPSKSGLPQNAADVLKLLIKEDYTPKERKRILYFAAPLIVFCPIITAFCLIPLGNFYTISDSFPSTIIFMGLILIPATAVFLAGYSIGRQPLISSIQAISDMIGYTIPMIICVLTTSFMAGTLNINGIIQEQSSPAGIFGWYFIPQIIGCIVFFICILVLLSRTPFNCSKAENELLPDYIARYSGLKYAFFIFSEYALIFLVLAFFTCVHLGGYLSPFGAYIIPDFLIPLEQGFWLLLKVFLLFFFIILIKTSLPKLNRKRFLEFSYKILLPLSLINLNIVVLIRYFAGIQ